MQFALELWIQDRYTLNVQQISLTNEIAQQRISSKTGEPAMVEIETYQEQKTDNLRAYDQLKQEIPRRYSGQYVVIGRGKILLSAPTYKEAWEQLKNNAPDALHFMIFPADKSPFLETVKVRNHGKIRLACS